MEHLSKEAMASFSYVTTNLDGSSDHSEQASECDRHDTPPVDLVHSGICFNETESNDTEEEDEVPVEEDHVRHFPALTEVDFDNNRIAATDEVRIKALSDNVEPLPAESEEESDYEEPRKVNGTPSSSVEDTEIRIGNDGAEADQLVPTAADVPSGESAECVVCDRCLKCGELINSNEKVNAACPHFHVNCFRCAHCDCLVTGDFILVGGAPHCKNHSTFLSGDAAKEKSLSVMKQDDGEVSPDAPSLPMEAEDRDGQDLHRGSPPRSDDVLPPTGSAKRLVEQWSNIEALKASQNFTNTALSDSPQYAPNTARTIAAKFSAGATGDQQATKSKMSTEPTEQWPSQGQARGLIAKFSAMHA